MNIEHAAKQIIDSINTWKQSNSNLVVGIEGYSGAGKTTLLEYMAEKYDFIQPFLWMTLWQRQIRKSI